MASMAVRTTIRPYGRQQQKVQGLEKRRRAGCGPALVRFEEPLAAAFCGGSFSTNLQGRLSLTSRRQTSVVRSEHAIAAAATVVGQETTETVAFRISQTFVELRKQGKVAFIPYLTAGDPNLDTTAAAVKLLDKCGADIIELGVPYSDPLADGPVIQAAASRGIRGGTNLDSVLTLMREEFSDIKAPIVVFLYYNPLLKRGVEKFLEEAKAAGASGLVVPDLPLEETGKLRKLTAAAGLELVLLTTPTTPRARMAAITEASQGFIYLVSLTGVTGARDKIESRVEGLVKDIKLATNKPVAVGFGVSTPQQAAKLAEWGADGVIIGSAFVKLLGESGTAEEGLRDVEDFAVKVRSALAPRCDVAPACPLVCALE